MPKTFANAHDCAYAIIDQVGFNLRLAAPVGIGKPCSIINALYDIAEADKSINLRIFSGLSLLRPHYGSDLERRFVEPLLNRLFGSYPDLKFAEAARNGTLPANISVEQFFLQAGECLDSPSVQQNFVSLNYLQVARHLQRLNVNVMGQLVAPDPSGNSNTVSLSSNPDVALDMRGYVAGRRRRGLPVAVMAEINTNLPFMGNRAGVEIDHFDFILEPEKPHFDLFAPPKMPVTLTDYAMALRTASLVKDGGTIQIGIGAFGDALTHALVLRHKHNALFRELLNALGPEGCGRELDPFFIGLYGCTELLTEGFLKLQDEGIVTRKVVATGDGDAAVSVHAGFFIGSVDFYNALRTMTQERRDEIGMMPISFTNSLLGDDKRRRMQRRDARFINTALMATLLGAITSDQLEDGRVVSGIGGQNDFVTMAQNVPGVRSILALHSTRTVGGNTQSNIVWRYGYTSIPRQSRDIVVTEYGIADLRGKSDGEVITAMLSIADARFQDKLLDEARKAKKVEKAFKLSGLHSYNTPERITDALRSARASGYLPVFPLGSEMTPIEQTIVGALAHLKAGGLTSKLRDLAEGSGGKLTSADETAALQRMSLHAPGSIRENLMRRILLGALRRKPAA